MIGVSLPYDWLNGEKGLLGDKTEVLNKLMDDGVKSIELRTVRGHHNPDDVLNIAGMLWDLGFEITVHSAVKSGESAVNDIFSPLKKLLLNLKQKKLNVTIHPIVGDNVAMLTEISDFCIKNNYPVTIALENNRKLPDNTEGDSIALVLDAVKKVNRENVGTCFDLGHYLYYLKKNKPECEDLLPDPEFLSRTIHTHIHALNGMKTHFPLGLCEIPLKNLLNALQYEYFGVYNIELDFPRFDGLFEPMDALAASVKSLKDNMPLCAEVYDDIRNNFDSWMKSALRVLDGNEKGTKFGLIHASSYVFNTNGYKWALDLAYRNALHLAELPKKSAELLSDLDLMIISHGHVDHFEEKTVKMLKNTDIKWVIPDFLLDKALEWGITRDKVYVARKNVELKIGKLTILPFESRHFRPITNAGLDEYGYYITAENSPSMVFPVDIRNHSLEGLPLVPMADYCFANVWMGDGNCLEEDFSPVDSNFAKFMLKFSDKNIFLTHLYENGRPAEYMWTKRHADIIAKAIHNESPTTVVHTPDFGEVIDL